MSNIKTPEAENPIVTVVREWRKKITAARAEDLTALILAIPQNDPCFKEKLNQLVADFIELSIFDGEQLERTLHRTISRSCA